MSKSFEECLPVVNQEIEKRKNKWHLNPVTLLDFDDVSQILRIHVHEKWHLWDQSLPLKNWLNRVISNQIINLIRNNYGNLAPPCSRCPHNQIGGLCSYTQSGEKDTTCDFYKKWIESKRVGFEMRAASSIDDPDNYSFLTAGNSSHGYDLERSLVRFKDILKERLSRPNYEVFELIYIDNQPEEYVAKKMGFFSNEEGRKAGYKQIYNIKKKILEVSKEILEEEEVFYD